MLNCLISLTILLLLLYNYQRNAAYLQKKYTVAYNALHYHIILYILSAVHIPNNTTATANSLALARKSVSSLYTYSHGVSAGKAIDRCLEEYIANITAASTISTDSTKKLADIMQITNASSSASLNSSPYYELLSTYAASMQRYHSDISSNNFMTATTALHTADTLQQIADLSSADAVANNRSALLLSIYLSI